MLVARWCLGLLKKAGDGKRFSPWCWRIWCNSKCPCTAPKSELDQDYSDAPDHCWVSNPGLLIKRSDRWFAPAVLSKTPGVKMPQNCPHVIWLG